MVLMALLPRAASLRTSADVGPKQERNKKRFTSLIIQMGAEQSHTHTHT